MKTVQLDVILPVSSLGLPKAHIWVRNDGAPEAVMEYRGYVEIEEALLVDLAAGEALIRMMFARAGLAFLWTGWKPAAAAKPAGLLARLGL